MRKEVYINKVVFTAEAKFDYEEGMQLGKSPKADIKQEIEEYLHIKQSEEKLTCCRYFRLKYYDEANEKMLMLFIYKGITLGKMQMWDLAGICLEEDWDMDIEEDGLIRNWLNLKVEDLPQEDDFVVRLRQYEKEKQAYIETYSLHGLDKEVKNAITNGGYDAYSEKYDYVSYDDGKWNGRPRIKKANGISRKER